MEYSKRIRDFAEVAWQLDEDDVKAKLIALADEMDAEMPVGYISPELPKFFNESTCDTAGGPMWKTHSSDFLPVFLHSSAPTKVQMSDEQGEK